MSAPQDKRPARGEEAGATARRKPYAAPRLKAYGSVSKLTQGAASAGQDGSGMSKNTMCL